MAALPSDLRRQLENVCVQARELAEAAARSALQKRAVDAADSFPHFTTTDKELRTRLRARGRQAGDVRQANKTQAIDQLTQELAYEYWHRMLFARFLAENNLLMHPDGVAVSLEECEELAKAEKAPNGFVLAARYASRMLPQVFRTDDVLLEIEFAPEHRIALGKELSKLPRDTFLAADSLGWVYQFWQVKKKDEVNASGDKIDGRTLPAVTQLFTEHYMVQFLLHNTIGAWWCARRGIKGPAGGAGVPDGQAPLRFEYLRWWDDGTPAAGTFDGWPGSLKEFTMLDPCCGSGHFLVAAFNLLVPLRMHDDGLSAQAACDAVLRDNLFGLEIDPRCTQIAAFALALAAWKYPTHEGRSIGYRQLPTLNLACSGQGVTGKKEEWHVLAGANSRLQEGMHKLYEDFQQAPHLGSLIDLHHHSGDMFTATYAELEPLLATALSAHSRDADLHAVGVAAQGIATAADLLGRKYTLLTTNVPYLGRGMQSEVIKHFAEDHYGDAKADLATVFLSRMLDWTSEGGGTVAVVTPQNWLFLKSYMKFRRGLLQNIDTGVFAKLGFAAFQIMDWWAFGTCLVILSIGDSRTKGTIAGLDTGSSKIQSNKAGLLQSSPLKRTSCEALLSDPDTVIAFLDDTVGTRLGKCARSLAGVDNGDTSRFRFVFWELSTLPAQWVWQVNAVSESTLFGGRQHIQRWEGGTGAILECPGARISNVRMWGRSGVYVTRMNRLSATTCLGTAWDRNGAMIVPFDEQDLAAIWCFCSSPDFFKHVRSLNQKVSVAEATFEKVPFDLAHWRKIAMTDFPKGLPAPESDDPTQWLFHGRPEESTLPLHVAVARLLGYRWPPELDNAIELSKRARDLVKHSEQLARFIDFDGIVCLPAVRGKQPAAERVLELLHGAYGRDWSTGLLQELLSNVEAKPGESLDDWLRNSFFEQHCKLFHQRPFVWHIWDGYKDGFSCLVNYHKLNHKTLENLTYSYLGDWIKTQNADTKAGQVGADLRLASAQALQEKLKLILAGEPPYDVFVRWKPLSEQAVGWNPDLNDGVRMNIRPFIEAGILRKTPNIKWTKDRGKEPERDRDEYPWFWNGKEFVGDRVNDVHLSNAEKLATRKATG